jgi:hypothetical protein
MDNDREDQPSTEAKVAHEGAQVVETARQQSGEVVAAAREHAGDVAGSAVEQGKHLVDEARETFAEQARTRTAELSRSVRRLGDGMKALADGRPEEAGPAADYAREAAARTRELAQRLERRGYDGIADDVAQFARRRPGTFLLSAGLLGFAVGRVLRSGALSKGSSDGSSRGTNGAAPGAAGVRAQMPTGAVPSTEAPLSAPVDRDPTLAATGALPTPGGRP